MARVPVRPLLAHHHEFEYGPADYGRVSAGIRRVSWASIVAGAVVALALQVGLSALGAAIGIADAETWAGTWLLVSALVAMFAGGLLTGRLAGMPRLGDGAVHGLVTWGVATLAAATVLATALAPAPPAPSTAAASAPAAVDLAAPPDLSAIQAEAAALLVDTVATDGGAALATAIDDALGGSQSASDAQQDALAAALADATDLTEAQARQTVGRWIVQVEEQRGGLDGAAPLELVVPDAGPGLALWTTLALFLGALAAVLGGAAGTPGTLPAAPSAPVPPTEPTPEPTPRPTHAVPRTRYPVPPGIPL